MFFKFRLEFVFFIMVKYGTWQFKYFIFFYPVQFLNNNYYYEQMRNFLAENCFE
uniref:Uncharacterized protein n=1 Tax=Anguilla anguilla TaxID=7936 RepID=A0A0E9T5G8_ANGAN